MRFKWQIALKETEYVHLYSEFIQKLLIYQMITKLIAYFNLALSAFNLQFRRTVFSFHLSVFCSEVQRFAQKIAWYYHKTGYPSPFHLWYSWPMKVMSTQIWTRNVLIMKMNSFYFAMIGIWKSVSFILQKK